MEIETVLAAMDLPARSLVNQPMDRLSLLNCLIATHEDEHIIRQDVEKLTLLASLNTDTTGVPARVEARREYVELLVIEVTLPPHAHVGRAGYTLHHVIPSHAVLLIKRNGLYFSIADKKRNSHNRNLRAISGVANWCSLSDPVRLASLRWGDMPKDDLSDPFHRWSCSVDALKVARLTGEFEILLSGERARQRWELLGEYSRLFSRLRWLKRDAKFERFGGKTETDGKIAKIQEQMESIRRSLRRTPSAPSSSESNPVLAPRGRLSH